MVQSLTVAQKVTHCQSFPELGIILTIYQQLMFSQVKGWIVKVCKRPHIHTMSVFCLVTYIEFYKLAWSIISITDWYILRRSRRISVGIVTRLRAKQAENRSLILTEVKT
jgi:uncharacterized membrane protein